MLSKKIKSLLKIFYISLLFFVCHQSWTKYKTGRTSTEIRKNHIEKVQYPSVTVCVEYALKKFVDISNQSNLSYIETKNLIKENIWNRNETFFFVNQASNIYPGYPCITSKGSYDPGRPCSL